MKMKKASTFLLRLLVLGTGLEPVQTKVHWILSPTCLPIPPPEQKVIKKFSNNLNYRIAFKRSIKTPPSHRYYLSSGRRDSNPRPQPWQGCALPTELLSLISR